MASPRVPLSGIVLSSIPGVASKGAVHGLQAMQISFADNAVLEEVLRHGSDLKISFGKSMRLDYGDESMEIVPRGESHRHELYKRADGHPEVFEFVGQFSHNLEVREEDNSLNESLLRLENEYEILNEEKAASTTSIVDIGELPKPVRRTGPLRKAPYLKKNKNRKTLSAPTSVPTTPSMRSGRSPMNTSTTGTSAEAKAEQDALRLAIGHLLAVDQMSEHSLASKTRAPLELVSKVLSKISKRTAGGRWQLCNESYRDLDVWEFPYPSQAIREKAIASCREAFTKLRLEKRDPEWRMLLSPEERDKPGTPTESAQEQKPVTARPIPKPASENGRSPLPPTVDAKKSGKEVTRPAPKAAKSTKSTDPLARIIAGKGKKKTAAAPALAKPKGRPPKNPATTKSSQKANNPKIKSEEIIVDSDEEDIEMLDVPSKPPPPRPIKKVVSPMRKSTPAPKPSPRPASDIEDNIRLNPSSKRPSSGSTASKSPAKKPRVTPPTSTNSPAQQRPQTNGYSKPPSVKPRETVSQRSSSNSPHKPSPLGSSPPINASDADPVSTASSPSFMTSNTGASSTASQSPLDSLSGRAVTKPRYVPPVSSLKPQPRKAVKKSPDPAAMKLARRFKEEYSRYERLYREVQATTDLNRKKEKYDTVMTLHRDLERLKSRISSMAH